MPEVTLKNGKEKCKTFMNTDVDLPKSDILYLVAGERPHRRGNVQGGRITIQKQKSLVS